jgi:fluoride ion exporter CrcB/FEX
MDGRESGAQMSMFFIVLAGTGGCCARWGIEEIVERRVLSHRPFATMFINAFGCLIAGFVAFGAYHFINNVHTDIGSGPFVLQPTPSYGAKWLLTATPYLLTGFCGGFTTFSSALAIPYLDWSRGNRARAASLLMLTPVLCVLGYWIGELLTHLFF